MNKDRTTQTALWLRWSAAVALIFFVGALAVGTMRNPHFWMTADQGGDRLFAQKKFSDSAKAYSDPWRIGVAQYRNGDFEMAAKTFARVPGADGAFDQGNAWLMRGNYDAAIQSYDRALGFRPGWKDAEENKALAAARKAKLEASSKHREQEQLGSNNDEEMTPDKIVFDLKGGNQNSQPMELNGEKMSDQELRATWLRRVQTTPGDFLRTKFAYQAAQAQQNGATGTKEEAK